MRVDREISVGSRFAVPPLPLVTGLALLVVFGAGASPQTSLKPRPVSFEADRRVGTAADFLDGADQTEPTIAVNPTDPYNLVAGFHDLYPGKNDLTCRSAVSFDGGRTWTPGAILPMKYSTFTCSDSGLAADPGGRFYYSYVEFDGQGASNHGNLLHVAVSNDGGRTFPDPSVVVEGVPFDYIDKPYIASDAWPASRYRGSIYVTYEFGFGPTTDIRVVLSRDAGRTWSVPALIAPAVPDTEVINGTLPVVAPDGTVYVFYSHWTIGVFPGGLAIRYVRSRDGGITWSRPADVAANLPTPGYFILKNAATATEPNQGFRSNSFPTAAITPDGAIYVVWVDFPNGSCTDNHTDTLPCVNADVRMAVSRDGRRWSTPIKVTDETNATDQFMPWIGAHADGTISILWQDKRLDAANDISFDAFYTNTRDGSKFLRNIRLSSASSMPGTLFFLGDYNNLAATPTGIVGVWNDLRTGIAQIWSAVGTLGP